MLATIVALLALLAEPVRCSGAPTARNHYVVDLGYQLNLGNAVVVS